MDMETLMAQAQELQSKIAAAQESLANQTVKGMTSDGLVVVAMTGKYDIVSVNIQPKAMTLDAQNLSKLVMDAYKDAKSKADTLIDSAMSGVTSSIE